MAGFLYEEASRIKKIPWRRKWQPVPVFLPGKSHGQRSLAGYSPGGSQRVGHNWSDFTYSPSVVNSAHFRFKKQPRLEDYSPLFTLPQENTSQAGVQPMDCFYNSEVKSRWGKIEYLQQNTWNVNDWPFTFPHFLHKYLSLVTDFPFFSPLQPFISILVDNRSTEEFWSCHFPFSICWDSSYKVQANSILQLQA